MIFQINETGLFYFFSAMAQSAAALVAVVGMFAVFRLQLQETKIGNTYSRALEIVRPIENFYFTGSMKLNKLFVREEIKERFREIASFLDSRYKDQNIPERSKGEALKNKKVFEDFLKQITFEEKIVEIIKNGLKEPLILITVVFLVSAALLPFSSKIASLWFSFGGYFFVCIILVLVFFAIWRTIQYIFRSIK